MSDVGYKSILLYLFQLNFYKSAFFKSNTFQRTFQHIVDANSVLQSVTSPLPPLQRASTQALPSLPAPAFPPPSTTDQEIKIIQGITYSSKNHLHAGHRYSKDGKLLTDGRQLLYDNGSDERLIIILATSDNLAITEESTIWFLDGTFKSAPRLFYQLLVLHAELTDTPEKYSILPTVYILLTQKDTPPTLKPSKPLPPTALLFYLFSTSAPRNSLELRLIAATSTSTSARQSSGTSTNLVTRPSMKQSLLILPLVQRSTLLSTPG